MSSTSQASARVAEDEGEEIEVQVTWNDTPNMITVNSCHPIYTAIRAGLATAAGVSLGETPFMILYGGEPIEEDENITFEDYGPYLTHSFL